MMGFGASAVAGENSAPVMLTDAQMDNLVAGHRLMPPGNDKTIAIGGPLPTAQGHFRGLDCNAAGAGRTPFGPLGICVK
jgi:hypothetical protein